MNFSNSSFSKIMKNPLIILIVGSILVLVVYLIKPLKEPDTPGLSFDPLTGAVVIDTSGNNDGQINPGEKVNVFLRLTNFGENPTSAFDLLISTREKGVKIIDNKVHFSPIDTDQTVISDDPFEFNLDINFTSPCILFFGTIENQVNAGFVTDAYAQGNSEDVAIILEAVTNYRICLNQCKLQALDSTDPDTLIIDLSLCNASTNSFSTASIRIDSLKIKICDSPTTPFNVVTESVGGFQVKLDSLWFTTTILSNKCEKPNRPIDKFKFKVTTPTTLASNQSICVYFTVLVYQSTTLVARAYIGTEALIQNSTSVISHIRNELSNEIVGVTKFL